MSKVCTHGRDKATAMQQLEESLRRLQTDHLDVWQIHEVIYWNDSGPDHGPERRPPRPWPTRRSRERFGLWGLRGIKTPEST
jgi:diketogulonate reductase-like aldo/keto reductase